MRMSAPIRLVASCCNASRTRSANSPTVARLPTASTSASSNTRHSPARQSRRSRLRERRRRFIFIHHSNMSPLAGNVLDSVDAFPLQGGMSGIVLTPSPLQGGGWDGGSNVAFPQHQTPPPPSPPGGGGGGRVFFTFFVFLKFFF